MPTQLEVANAKKVLAMLEHIDGISYDQIREDIFSVTENETGTEFTATVDVEESTVSILMEICDIPEDKEERRTLYALLLEMNAASVHGFFAVCNDKVIIKDNLEIENLDQNELEATLLHIYMNVAKNMDTIINTIGAEIGKEGKQ